MHLPLDNTVNPAIKNRRSGVFDVGNMKLNS